MMTKPVPPELGSFTENIEEIEARDKHPLWKLKGISSQMTYRMFSKYGNKICVDEKYEAFSEKFNATYSKGLLETHL
jgi:hypothetical protein